MRRIMRGKIPVFDAKDLSVLDPKMCYTVWGGVIDDEPGKESETLEFKKTASELKEAMISISSILNKHGVGTLYFGVKPNGKCLV